jgi:hypothetical protein
MTIIPDHQEEPKSATVDGWTNVVAVYPDNLGIMDPTLEGVNCWSVVVLYNHLPHPKGP